MLGTEDLKEKIEITETTVECPVRSLGNCCDQKVKRQRHFFKKSEEFKCPRHNIWISASTFEYEKDEDNLLWKDEPDLALLRKIGGVKRESRMARDNSEDAVTWNVFRFLEKNNLVEGFLRDVIGVEAGNAEIIYWSYSQREKKGLALLDMAREEFGEEIRRGSEPDLILRAEKTLSFIEAKLNSGNKTLPNDKDKPKRYETGGNGWFKKVFTSGYRTAAITEKKYELMRFWLLGTWMAEQTGLDFCLINLVKEGKEEDIEKLFKKHILETPRRKFIRLTWESIYRYLANKCELRNKDIMIRFFRNKSIGYKDGVLQKAFSV